MDASIPIAHSLALAGQLASCLSVVQPKYWLSWNIRKISIGFSKKGYNPPHCTVPICWPFARAWRPAAHVHIEGWLALEKSSCQLLSCHTAIACFTSPEKICCAFCSTSIAVLIITSHEQYICQSQKARKCVCGTCCPLGRIRNVLLRALASQRPSTQRTEQNLQMALTGN